jgi:hypothetical protein
MGHREPPRPGLDRSLYPTVTSSPKDRGKEELAAETIRWSGAIHLQLLGLFVDPAPDLVTGIEQFFAGAAVTLRESDYADDRADGGGGRGRAALKAALAER